VAKTDAMRTSLVAFKMSAVAFMIPFAFLADEALLFRGSYVEIAIASAGLILSTIVWSMGVTGFIVRRMNMVERVLLLLCGAGAMVTATGSAVWMVSNVLAIAYVVLHILMAQKKPQVIPGH
jgi:TRAP-type uncharacterized transport system fused permease subunit